MLEKIKKIAGKFIKHVFLYLPVNPRIIMFYAHDRKGLCCNPKYILCELIKHKDKKYLLYWVSDYPKTVPKSKVYRIIKKRSFRYYYIFARAKIFITNDMLDELLIKKKGQIIINTWHGGGAFKKAGYDLLEADEHRELFCKWYGRTDYMIVSSEYLYFTFMRAFKLKPNQILKTGMPRCDLFFRDNNFYQKIREIYHLDLSIKILLYAPTYRYEEYELLNDNELEKILAMLEKKFEGHWICLFRAHQFDKNNRKKNQNKNVIDCSDYSDVQEILCATDLLLSDYSSLLWEFSLLDRPVISYAKSPKQYKKLERGFYVPYEKWPYPKAENLEELLNEIARFDNKKYQKNIRDFNNFLGGYEDGKSAEKVCVFLEELLKKDRIQK